MTEAPEPASVISETCQLRPRLVAPGPAPRQPRPLGIICMREVAKGSPAGFPTGALKLPFALHPACGIAGREAQSFWAASGDAGPLLAPKRKTYAIRPVSARKPPIAAPSLTTREYLFSSRDHRPAAKGGPLPSSNAWAEHGLLGLKAIGPGLLTFYAFYGRGRFR